jgi:hypothetical protein
VVHAARHRVGACLGAGVHQRQASAGLIDQRAGELERAVVEGMRAAAHEQHDRLDLAALVQRHEQRVAGHSGLREARGVGRELLVVAQQQAARGARHPAHAGRALTAGQQVAEAAVGVEHVHDDQLLLTLALGEMVEVDLLGARDHEQLAGELAIDDLRAGGPVGQQREPAHARQHRLRPRRQLGIPTSHHVHGGNLRHRPAAGQRRLGVQKCARGATHGRPARRR